MNPNKFAFIICTNDDLYLQECFHYLNQLILPEGYETEVLTLVDAKSMTSGYNEGMSSTDAKYKIYMHQDVFITNRYFLSDILSIFQSDAAIGMIGMVGYPVVSDSGFMWLAKRAGITYPYGAKKIYPHADYNKYRYSLSQGIEDVSLIDGLMMVTAYDLPWNEDELTDWHFYDAFQSMNYLFHGYRVVVPTQTLPWFIHDDGFFLSMWDYDKYRQLFMNKYKDYLGKSCYEIRSMTTYTQS